MHATPKRMTLKSGRHISIGIIKLTSPLWKICSFFFSFFTEKAYNENEMTTPNELPVENKSNQSEAEESNEASNGAKVEIAEVMEVHVQDNDLSNKESVINAGFNKDNGQEKNPEKFSDDPKGTEVMLLLYIFHKFSLAQSVLPIDRYCSLLPNPVQLTDTQLLRWIVSVVLHKKVVPQTRTRFT